MMSPIAPKIYATDLQAFVEKAFRSTQGRKLIRPQLYISYIVYYLELFLQGDIRNLLVNLPGRHLKTFICSVCLPAFMLGTDPTLKFLIVAYNEERAEDIVLEIRKIMRSPWYRAVFKTRLDDGHSRKNDFQIVGGGRVRAAPVRSVTGIGGDVIIFDDPHNADDWDNDRKKAKVIQAFELLVSRRDGGSKSKMLVVGHRLAPDDLSAHILERKDFEHICLPLFAPKNMSFNFGHTTWKLAKGEALRPDAFPPNEISSIRQHHEGSPFWLYYQQGLGPKISDFEIDASHFPFVAGGGWGNDQSTGHVVLSVDPAQKTESSSRNVIHVYAVHGNRYDFLQAFAEKCSFMRLARKVRFLATRYRASLIIIENTARGPDLVEELRRDVGTNIITVTPHGPRDSRWRKCIPIVQARRVRIKKDRAEVDAAVDEILAYPNGIFDDHVDAMANFLLEAATFTSDTFARARPSQLIRAARGTARSANAMPAPTGAVATARPPSEPIYCFDGEKMVLIRPSSG